MARTLQPSSRLSAFLCAAMSVSSGCVVPIGPEFEDEPNLAPYIVSSTPRPGAEILGPPAAEPKLTVEIGDPNIHDVLWVRWIYDYPPWEDRSAIAEGTRRIEPSGTAIRGPMTPFEPDCLFHPVAKGFSRYRLNLVVSDREFTQGPDDAPFDAVPDGALRVSASWVLNMECK